MCKKIMFLMDILGDYHTRNIFLLKTTKQFGIEPLSILLTFTQVKQNKIPERILAICPTIFWLGFNSVASHNVP